MVCLHSSIVPRHLWQCRNPFVVASCTRSKRNHIFIYVITPDQAHKSSSRVLVQVIQVRRQWSYTVQYPTSRLLRWCLKSSLSSFVWQEILLKSNFLSSLASVWCQTCCNRCIKHQRMWKCRSPVGYGFILHCVQVFSALRMVFPFNILDPSTRRNPFPAHTESA